MRSPGDTPVFDRDGLIIDVRHNRGGNIDSWVLSRLLRKAWFYWQPRVGRATWNMQHAFRGHIVVDNLPHATFKGEDAQLDAAVKHVLDLIKTRPVPVPPAPPYPIKRGGRGEK